MSSEAQQASRMTAHELLDQMRSAGLTIADLTAAAREDDPMPTVSEYRPRVEESLSAGAVSTYKTYFNDLEEAYGSTKIDRISTTDLKILMKKVTDRAKSMDRKGVHGRSAAEHMFSAARAFFKVAVEDGLLTANPGLGLEKPKRLKGQRRPLTAEEQALLFEAVGAEADDPKLDHLLVWFHLETGARRSGALNLRMHDLDDKRQTLWLREKYEKVREQPVSRTLLDALRVHAQERGASHLSDPVFHYRPYSDGRPHPLTRKRYDTLFGRLREVLPYVRLTALDCHSLRHTAIAMVERVAGYEVARAFAGHAEKEVTSTYAAAGIEEVAAAVAILTGEPHPLAPWIEVLG